MDTTLKDPANLDSYQINNHLELRSLLGADAYCGDAADILLMLETKMVKKYDKIIVLRSLCLFSQIQGGLDAEQYDYLVLVFLMNYGYQDIVTLMNLEDAGLLKRRKDTGEAWWDWKTVASTFDLVEKDEEEIKSEQSKFSNLGIFNPFKKKGGEAKEGDYK